MTDAVPPASLLDWILGLVTDPAARARFAVDPRGALGEQGLADLDPVDLHHALPLVTDTVAARVDATVTSPAPPALLQGETPVEALVRQFTAVSHTVTPGDPSPPDRGPDDTPPLDPPSEHRPIQETATMTIAGPGLDPAPDALPDPGTDAGWAALEAEALRHGFPSAQAYVAAYAEGRINVGAAGYQPGNAHTGFGQVQAYEHAAGRAGVDLNDYAAQHTPEALARARGEEPPDQHGGHGGGHDGGHGGGHGGGHDGGHGGHGGGHHGGHDGHGGGHDGHGGSDHDGGHGSHPTPLGGDHPFTPPANFTSFGWPIEYSADGTPQIPVFVVAPTLPEGVDHYDRYTGEPLDAADHIVPGVPRAGENHQFTTGLDQRIGLDDRGRIDPKEVERLEVEARENGQASVTDQIAATTRPFPGHPLSDTGQFARPVVAPGQAPAVYSGPDGTYIVTAGGTVLTGAPGSELTYHGKDGSATIDPLGRTVTTDPEGRTTVHEPTPEIEFDGGPAGPFIPDTPLDDHVPGDGVPSDLEDGIDDFGVDGEVVFVEDPAPGGDRLPPEFDADDGQVQNILVQTPDEARAGTGHTPGVGGFGTGTAGAEDGGFGSGGQETTIPRPRDEGRQDRDDDSGRSSGSSDDDPGSTQETTTSSSGEDNGEHGHGGGHDGAGDGGDSGGDHSGGHESAGMEHAG